MSRALGNDPLRQSLFKKTDGEELPTEPTAPVSPAELPQEHDETQAFESSAQQSFALEEELPEEVKMIGFHLGRREFGMDIGSVQRVIRMVEITRVPHSLPFLEGVIDLMGAIVPVVSLRRLFGVTHHGVSLRNHIIIGEKDGRLLGLIVDGVSDLLDIPRTSIDAPTHITPLREFLLGVVRLRSKIIFLIKLDRMIDMEKEVESYSGMDIGTLADEIEQMGTQEESDDEEEKSTPEAIEIQRILRERAIDISRKVEIEDIATRQLLTFSLGDEWYGVDTASVQSIQYTPRLVMVPCAPAYIRGVMNLRGEIVTVLDLKRIFGLEAGPTSPESRVIVVKREQSLVAFEVDSVYDVIDLQTNLIERPLSTIEKIRADFIEGEARLDDRLLGILKLETVTSTAQAI